MKNIKKQKAIVKCATWLLDEHETTVEVMDGQLSIGSRDKNYPVEQLYERSDGTYTAVLTSRGMFGGPQVSFKFKPGWFSRIACMFGFHRLVYHSTRCFVCSRVFARVWSDGVS